ncbi:MAG: hypothetical protein KKE29_19865 [Proteobacteria bacterium]|nr:hypothetical protein [Pseudomonadota bacterium]MBU4574434.1 hypothetical protein [Pseudomonadota bacterium]MBV1715947.1 hypothetical protein [Desulfarculus sp.]
MTAKHGEPASPVDELSMALVYVTMIRMEHSAVGRDRLLKRLRGRLERLRGELKRKK